MHKFNGWIASIALVVVVRLHVANIKKFKQTKNGQQILVLCMHFDFSNDEIVTQSLINCERRESLKKTRSNEFVSDHSNKTTKQHQQHKQQNKIGK